MNIDNYAVTQNCGYGIRGTFYETDLTVSSYSSTIKSASASRSLSWEKTSYLPVVRLNECETGLDQTPFFLIHDADSNEWKEYFTGITVDVIRKDAHQLLTQIQQRGKSTNCFFAEQNDICYDGLTVITSQIQVLNSIEFAVKILKYPESVKKIIAAYVIALNEAAVSWKNKVDLLCQEAVQERITKENTILKKMKEAEALLSSKLGKYSNENINESTLAMARSALNKM